MNVYLKCTSWFMFEVMGKYEIINQIHDNSNPEKFYWQFNDNQNTDTDNFISHLEVKFGGNSVSQNLRCIQHEST